MMLAENAPDFRPGAILIVGCGFDNDGHAAGRVAFINDLIELLCILAFAGAAFDRALYVIVRHALRARSLDGAAQARIGTGIAPAALCRDGDLLR